MKNELLLRVRESVTLTGLGVLLFPASEAARLQQFPLHTALQLRLRYLSGLEESSVATVEEVSRPGSVEQLSTTERVLLLTQQVATTPPVGTEVWWSGAQPYGY